MIRRKKNIAGFYGADGLFHPIRSPQFVGQQKRPAKLSDRKKYSRAKAGDLGKRKQMFAREDVFDKAIRRERELDTKDARQKARILAEIDRDVYGVDGDRRNKGKGRTLLQYVRGQGGVRRTYFHHGSKVRGRDRKSHDAGEINRLSHKETGVRGLTTDKGGLPMDLMYQSVLEAGYNVESADDMMSKIEDEATGGSPTYVTHGALSYNPAALGKTDLYVAQLGARSFGVFLKTYLLKKFATKLAAQNYMKSIRSRTKGNPKTSKRAGARAANPIKIKLYKFHAGQKLAARFIGDRETILHGLVISRTPKFVTVKIGGDMRRHSVKVHDGTELIYPLGKYSMAPIFRAKDGDRVGNPKSKKNPFPAMHPIAAAAAGLSAISTALHIHEQVKKSSMKKAPRRKASNRRKSNGTTSAKRQNPQDSGTLQKALNIYNKANLPLAVAYLKRSKLTASQKQNAIDSLKAWDAERKRNPKATKNPTPATLARCRKLIAEDKRSTRKQIAEIPISHYRRVANPKASASAKSPVKPAKRNGRRLRKVVGMKGRSRRVLPRVTSRKVKLSAGGKATAAKKAKRNTAANPRNYGDWVINRYGRWYTVERYSPSTAKADFLGGWNSDRGTPKRLFDTLAEAEKALRSAAKRKRKNPVSVPRRRTFEMFQGRPATKAVPVPVSHFYAGKRFDMLGDLIELKLHSGRVLKFNPTKTKLCAIGGKLILAGQGARIAKPNPAGLANGIDAIDSIDHVVYRTFKPHHGDSPNQQYIHKLGEETGHMPLLCADKQGYAVIRGGRYKIEARGIVN